MKNQGQNKLRNCLIQSSNNVTRMKFPDLSVLLPCVGSAFLRAASFLIHIHQEGVFFPPCKSFSKDEVVITQFSNSKSMGSFLLSKMAYSTFNISTISMKTLSGRFSVQLHSFTTMWMTQSLLNLQLQK